MLMVDGGGYGKQVREKRLCDNINFNAIGTIIYMDNIKSY